MAPDFVEAVMRDLITYTSWAQAGGTEHLHTLLTDLHTNSWTLQNILMETCDSWLLAANDLDSGSDFGKLLKGYYKYYEY